MNKKLIWLIVIFLLLVPLRLPIAVLFIEGVSYLATLAGELSSEILVANVIVTKLIYDTTLAVISIYKVQRLSVQIKGRVARGGIDEDSDMFWWSFVLIFVLLGYTIFDCITTYDLYYELN